MRETPLPRYIGIAREESVAPQKTATDHAPFGIEHGSGGVSARAYHVLIVDDEPANLDMLSARLLRRGYEVSTATSAAEAETVVTGRVPDIILLDIQMPGVTGLDYLRLLRRSPQTLRLPVIMVSGLTDTDCIVTAIHDGANDYVTKPINLPVLLARMETHLKMAGLLTHLEAQTQILANLAALDHLTGVYNRRSLFDVLGVEMSRSGRSNRALSALMLDLDHFKKINDTHGHAAGDRVLHEFAQRAREEIRPTDILARYGGEEFCVLLPETDGPSAATAAERIRLAVEARHFTVDQGPIPLTVSIGVATVSPPFDVSIEVIGCADRALYRAKNEGRNRVRVFSEDSTDTAAHGEWNARD